VVYGIMLVACSAVATSTSAQGIVSTEVLRGGRVREEIRLGNEALALNDLETARQCFQQVLVTEATEVQKRIAANRLREIEERQQQAEEPRKPSSGKPRTRRKTTAVRPPAEAPAHHFVRPPDKPVVVINRH
jgi:hypothetical protein